MKLVIAEYLRTLKERDELDRLLPDLLVEMGYVPIARPQTGNRQFGVDLAVRGKNSESGRQELVLIVVKQGDIGRTEWDGGNQAVRSSINEILDVYLNSHVDPLDATCRVRIVLVSNGELKQVVQASWSGFVFQNMARADLEFWGVDKLAELVERHLLDEYVFRDEDRKQLRRALALSGDSDYDQKDFHRLLLRTLGMDGAGALIEPALVGRPLLKALKIANFAARIFSAWAATDGDARQSLRAMERVLVWSWHRILKLDEADRNEAIAECFSSIWMGYLPTCKSYFEKIQAHCYVKDGLSGYYSDGCEFSIVAFEQIGMLATVGLAQAFTRADDEAVRNHHFGNAEIVADALASMIFNNNISSSPCLDRHSQDITLAMMLLIVTGRRREAEGWLIRLVRNVDYAYKSNRYVPVGTDSVTDLVEEGGWGGAQATERVLLTSWTLAVLAGWCAILRLDDSYAVLSHGVKDSYPQVCVQLWHPDATLYQHLYFGPAHFESGSSEAPIHLPLEGNEWRQHIDLILASDQKEIANNSLAAQAGVSVLDLIAARHFMTPVPPYTWYRLMEFANLLSNDGATTQKETAS